MNQKEALNDLRLQIKQLNNQHSQNKNETLQQQKREILLNEKNLAETRAKSAYADIEHLTVGFKKQQENQNRGETHVKRLSQKELNVIAEMLNLLGKIFYIFY